MERLVLQILTAFGALVLLAIGLSGALLGVQFLHGIETTVVDNYFRLASGIIAAMGAVYLASLPHVERHGSRFAVLTALTVAGGLAHLYGVLLNPVPSYGTLFGLFMELIFAPLVFLLQRHVARRAAATAR